MGRDLLTRMIYGARISLLIGLLSILWAVASGPAIGLIAGYAGGRVDAFCMRVADTTMAFPIILFAILLVSIMGGSLLNVVIAVALVLWARYARVIRGEVLSLRQRDFVAQARIAGCSFSPHYSGAPVSQYSQYPPRAVVPASGLGHRRRGVLELSWRRRSAAYTNLGLDDRGRA